LNHPVEFLLGDRRDGAGRRHARELHVVPVPVSVRLGIGDALNEEAKNAANDEPASDGNHLASPSDRCPEIPTALPGISVVAPVQEDRLQNGTSVA
jgi:hypothetical protein